MLLCCCGGDGGPIPFVMALPRDMEDTIVTDDEMSGDTCHALHRSKDKAKSEEIRIR